MNTQHGIYKIYDEKIPSDKYEVISVVQNKDGTFIVLDGGSFKVNISFGFVYCLNICDEGARIQSYNKINGIQNYRKNDFSGNPFYSVSGDSDFMKWLDFESCGFSCQQNHYAVITSNDFIDIAAPFPPKIDIYRK